MARKDAAKEKKKSEQIDWGFLLATGLLQCYPDRAVEYLRLAVGTAKRRKAVRR